MPVIIMSCNSTTQTVSEKRLFVNNLNSYHHQQNGLNHIPDTTVATADRTLFCAKLESHFGSIK